jgi:hypothetical protein
MAAATASRTRSSSVGGTILASSCSRVRWRRGYGLKRQTPAQTARGGYELADGGAALIAAARAEATARPRYRLNQKARVRAALLGYTGASGSGSELSRAAQRYGGGAL